MNLVEFKNHVEELNLTKSSVIRERYVRNFVEKDSEHYKKYISVKQQFSDGLCYTGYIWDCIREGKLIDYTFVVEYLKKKEKVFVMWDIHSCDRIFIKDYWKFEKESVLEMATELLLNNLIYLPEDIYIFDDSYEWTIILTHEEIKERQYCLFAKQ